MTQLQELIEQLTKLEREGFTEVRVMNPSASQMCHVLTAPVVTSERFERVSIVELDTKNEPLRSWVKQVRINPSN